MFIELSILFRERESEKECGAIYHSAVINNQ